MKTQQEREIYNNNIALSDTVMATPTIGMYIYIYILKRAYLFI